MRFFNYLFFFIFLSITTRAQQNHYIYIQTEDKQAFYVKLNEKIFSSSASGYVIIPKLTDGQYKLSIGFPHNEWPVQNVDVVINSKDEGFVLKIFDSKVWGLFNLQTMAIQFATDASVISNPAIENKTDAFSNTLAEVTNTPSIRQVETIKGETANVSPDTGKAIIKEDNLSSVPAVQISQVLSMIDNSGRSIIYAIKDADKIDSVRLFIPYDNKDAVAENAESKTWGEIRALAHDSTEKKDSMILSQQPVDNAIQKTEEGKHAVTNANDVHAGNHDYKVTIINPACKASATVDDLSKLGKKMSAAGNDDDRIAAAKKIFKAKCFTTEQVRNLCVLFSNDEGKYNFFDAAYSHVSDIGNFKDLQSQLTDEYYINRFKAMIR